MWFMELQARYLRDLLAEMFRRGITAIDASDEVTNRYNDLVDEVHSRTVWTHPGFGTYYRNSKGRVIFVMPFLNVEYWEFVRQLISATTTTTTFLSWLHSRCPLTRGSVTATSHRLQP